MIRIAEEGDVAEMLSIYAPYILDTTVTFEYDVPAEAEFLERFRSITAAFPWLVFEEGGRILGYAYGCAPFERAAFRWCCETAVYLRPKAMGRGIGRRLYTALESILTNLGYRKNYALITAENRVSLNFHEKMGYKTTARLPRCGYKFGRWLDLVWMEKELAVVEHPDRFPTLWKEIGQGDEKLSNILDKLSLSFDGKM